MKYIFSDKLIARYKKVPDIIWMLIFAVTIFLSNAFDLIEESGELSVEIIKIYTEAGINVKSSGIISFLIIGTVLLYTLAFELLARWLSGELIRRFRLNIETKEMVMRLRIVICIGNILIGLISLTALINGNVKQIVDSALEFPIMAILLMWFYNHFRIKVVPGRFHAKFFVFLARFYIGIFIFLAGYNFISYLFIYDVALTTVEIASISIELGVTLIIAGIAYLYSAKLKKDELLIDNDEDKPNNDNDPFNFGTIKVEEEKKEETIFKDFDI